MNRQAFLNLVEQPNLLGVDTLEGLALIVADYPFFQTARMLYVKNLAVVESIKYNSVLKTSAAFIANRDKLYSLVYLLPKDSPEPIIPITQAPQDISQSLINNELQSRDLESIPLIVEESSTVEIGAQDLLEHNEVLPQIVPDVVIDYFEVSDEVDFTSLSGNIPFIRSNVSGLSTGGRVNYFPDTPSLTYPVGDLLDFENENNLGYNLESDLKARDLDDTNGLSFSEWLIKMRQQKVAAEIPKSPKSEKMELINNFLKTKPKRIPRMVDFSPPEDAPKKVLDKSDSLLTETLANLYIKQTHFEKAIKIFEKLCLKYPEKNAYFANRIIEVEKLINNL